jgi:integrase/recombinase XerC
MATLIHSSVQPFVDYLKFEKRYPRNTIVAYQNDLEQFFSFLANEKTGIGLTDAPLAEIPAAWVRSWLASLKENKTTAKSINRKISSLKSFFKYYMRTGVLDQTPMTSIISPKIPKRLPKYVEQKDIQTLFTQVEFPDDWNGSTDRLLLEIFYNTGIRLSELVKLKESQVTLSGKDVKNTLKILGKGNKERIIPISKKLADSIKEYIKEKRDLPGACDTTFLLVNAKGKHLYEKYVYNAVKKYLSSVTTIDKKSPHVLRHTFATHLINNGADLNAIKELLGHSSLAATQVYTHTSIEKLKDIYQKAHPKA